MDNNFSKTLNIDVNSQDFYQEVQFEIESDLARMKTSIELLLNLRMTVAETEVETAALYHAELWHAILSMNKSPDISSDEEDGCGGDTEDNQSELDTLD